MAFGQNTSKNKFALAAPKWAAAVAAIPLALGFANSAHGDNTIAASPQGTTRLASATKPALQSHVVDEVHEYMISEKDRSPMAIIIMKGRKNESGLTGEDIYKIITKGFPGKVNSKPFIEQSDTDYTGVAVVIKDVSFGPWNMLEARKMAPALYNEYMNAYIVPEPPPKTTVVNNRTAAANIDLGTHPIPGGTN